jgi:hypothetical protein
MADKQKNRCVNHPERYAWIDRLGVYLCYECAYGKTLSDKKFGQEYYQPGGNGHAGDLKSENQIREGVGGEI